VNRIEGEVPYGDGVRTAERPWWLKALPFLGRAPALTPHQWRLMGVVGAANLFDNYGMAILGLALPQMSESRVSLRR
jgi:hypothetical protein